MSRKSIAEIRRYIENSTAERERVRKLPPVEFSPNDLDVACETLQLKAGSQPSKVALPPDPHQKARDNDLTNRAIRVIDANLKYNADIQDYMDNRHLDEDDFPERLQGCFNSVYNEYAGGNPPFYGDELFFGIIFELKERANSPHEQAAIEALLVYYFVRCEVFPWKAGVAQ